MRIIHIRLLIYLICSVLLVRLVVLTVVDGEYSRILAEKNRIRLVNIEASRGRIMDRNGRELAFSRQDFFLEKDGKLEGITAEQVKELASRGLAGENFEGNLGKIKREMVRVYPYGEMMAHVLGYVSRVQKEDLGKNSQLTNTDFVGRLGIEQTYENILAGVNGAKIVEVDASERAISILGEEEARSGQDITLTIDLDWQKKAYESLSSALIKRGLNSGAVVVTSPVGGEVLALVSLPSFDPSDIGRFVTDEGKPLFNRVVSGTYTPGSVFKIVSALSGLESGKISKDTEINDVGQFFLGDVKFSNWYFLAYGGRDGVLKIDRAIARSNDIFFYRLAETVGLETLRNQALELKFAQATGIDLPAESHGLVGDEVWKRANSQEEWYLGDTMHLAIGQGFVLATPLQVNVATAFVASGGKIIKPHLLARVASGDGREIAFETPGDSHPLVDPDNLSIVADGMRQACEKGGTGWPFFDAAYSVGCKTGTAEKAQGNPHAWFTAFAPFESPEISITVLVEEGGEGSSVAAPVAREVLDWWFAQR